jgi:hypothetical protein
MQVNCFTTTIREDGEPNYVLLRLHGTDVEALKYDGERYAIPQTMPLESIDPSRVQVTHYYGLDEVRYEGIWAIMPGLWTRWPYALIHFRRMGNAIGQRLFNRRALEVRRRLDILRDVVDTSMGGADAVDALDLMSARYGARWAGHPGWEAHRWILDRHLELLVQSGELEKFGHRYRPTGFALKTLEESEDEDRKHSANLRVQWLLAVLTLISALMAAAQANLLKLPTLVDLTEKSTEAPRVKGTSTASPVVPRDASAASPDEKTASAPRMSR